MNETDNFVFRTTICMQQVYDWGLLIVDENTLNAWKPQKRQQKQKFLENFPIA